jgi:hypothetical protein
MRWKYPCGDCQRDYDLPGADLSIFYGRFLGVSPCADAVAFDTVSFLGFDELQELIDSLDQELPQDDRSRWTSRALTEVCDPDGAETDTCSARRPAAQHVRRCKSNPSPRRNSHGGTRHAPPLTLSGTP